MLGIVWLPVNRRLSGIWFRLERVFVIVDEIIPTLISSFKTWVVIVDTSINNSHFHTFTFIAFIPPFGSTDVRNTVILGRPYFTRGFGFYR
ncbi:hypothetical protein D3C72_1806010 [compost metagenome]